MAKCHWKSFEKGPYRFKTYAETFEWAKQFASGLRALGLNPVRLPYTRVLSLWPAP